MGGRIPHCGQGSAAFARATSPRWRRSRESSTRWRSSSSARRLLSGCRSCWRPRAQPSQPWSRLRRRPTLSLEGVSQMVYILPERLLTLVRPAFDLVLQRIRSLKRCVQACGCKIETPRYACNLAPGCISSEPTFAGLRKNKKKENKGSQKPKKKGKWVSFGKAWHRLKCNLEPNCGAYLGVSILQPHACTQRFRL